MTQDDKDRIYGRKDAPYVPARLPEPDYTTPQGRAAYDKRRFETERQVP